MKCMQSELLSILPPRLRGCISKETLEKVLEIRLRLGYPTNLVCPDGIQQVGTAVGPEELNFCVNAASRYSPWNAATMKMGYLTAPGGHRIGLCGEAAGEGLRNLSSLCIRVAKDFPGIADTIPIRESLLLLGPPGSGKTTLLRDLIRKISREGRGSVAVVDERCEIFPISGGRPCFDPGEHTDVLSGCSKDRGIDMVLRSMGPRWIALDEITAERDCLALSQAAWCGVKLLATAHASGVSDLLARQVYAPLVQTKLFRTAVVLQTDKSYRIERI